MIIAYVILFVAIYIHNNYYMLYILLYVISQCSHDIIVFDEINHDTNFSTLCSPHCPHANFQNGLHFDAICGRLTQ